MRWRGARAAEPMSARQEFLPGMICRDHELPEQLQRQAGGCAARILHDDLGQGDSREIFARFGIDDANVEPFPNESGDFVQVDVLAS